MNLFNKKSSADEAASESVKKKTTKKSVKGLARTVQDVLQIDGITSKQINEWKSDNFKAEKYKLINGSSH